MAFEQRGSGRYYYQKKRVGVRVISEYIGGGQIGELYEMSAQYKAIKAEKERELQEMDRSLFEEPDNHLDVLAKLSDAVVSGYLLLNGFHKQQRTWRKKRN